MSNASYFFPYDSQAIHLFAILVFLLVIIIGIVCNMALCYVILKTKSLRTHLNSYIVNIAIADLCSCFVLIPLRIVAASEHQWDLNITILCGGEMFLRVTTDVAKLFFLGCVSYERYLAIANPFNRDKKIPKLRAVISTCVIWSTAVGLATFSTIQFNNVTLMEDCEFDGKSHSHGDVELFVIAPIFLLTVVLITLFYILIIRILMEHGSTMSKHLSGKLKAKVKPIDDAVPASSTTREQSFQMDSQAHPTKPVSMITLVADNSVDPLNNEVAETLSSKHEMSVNTQTASTNSVLCVITTTEISAEGNNHSTTMTSSLVCTDVPTEMTSDLVRTGVPTEKKSSLVRTDAITEMTSGLVRTGVPTEMTPSLVHTDAKTEMTSSLVRTGVPTEMTSSLVRTDATTEMTSDLVRTEVTKELGSGEQTTSCVTTHDTVSNDDYLDPGLSELKPSSCNTDHKNSVFSHISDKGMDSVALTTKNKTIEGNIETTRNNCACSCESEISSCTTMDVNKNIHLIVNSASVDSKSSKKGLPQILEENPSFPTNIIILVKEKNHVLDELEKSETNIQLPENINVFTDYTGYPTVNKDQLEQNKTVLSKNKTVLPKNKSSVISDENQLQQNKTVLSENQTVLSENKGLVTGECQHPQDNFKLKDIDNQLPQNKIVLSADDTKRIDDENALTQNKTVLSDKLIKQTGNENDISQNKATLSEDKTKPTENEKHILQDKTALSENNTKPTGYKTDISQNNVVWSEENTKAIADHNDFLENKTVLSETSCNTLATKQPQQENESSKENTPSFVNKCILSEKDATVSLKTPTKLTRSKSPTNKSKRSDKKGIRTVSVVAMDGSVHKESLTNASGAVCKRDDANKIRGRRKVELKAAKRIIAVIGTFFSLWIPYPVSVLLSRNMIHSESDHALWLHVMLLMSSVSVVASAVMPLLSGLSNKQIKSAALRIYKKMVCVRCKKPSTS